MTPATPHFSTTAAILAALQEAVGAVQLPDAFAPPGPAFGSVQMFDSENLVEAFQYLLITEQRVCVIVPLDANWEAESKQQRLVTRRTLPVALLISDRVIGNRQTALIGDAKTPGAMGLKDLVVPAVTGQLIANPNGVISLPVHESVMAIKDTAKKLPNRITIVLELNCRGGWLEAPLDRGITL